MNIVVTQNKFNFQKATLEVFDNNTLLLKTDAFIGKNGMTKFKKEGDKKTPIGNFELGVAFGTHKKEELKNFNPELNYIEINKNLYWVDDLNSKHYNKLVDITKIEKDWNSAEHLIDFPKQYEYAIEIKSNPKNIKGNGSAIFLHCSTGTPTAGCVAIPREMMINFFAYFNYYLKIEKQSTLQLQIL